MFMNTWSAHTIITALIIASFLLGAYLYPFMPERMATHWDAAGILAAVLQHQQAIVKQLVDGVFRYYTKNSAHVGTSYSVITEAFGKIFR